MTLGNKRSRLLLSSSNLIGRHWRCDMSIPLDIVPLHWVEIRWFGAYWAWRSLSSKDRTRGSGAILEHGWRRWSSGKISIGSKVSLELTDLNPPSICFENTETKKRKTMVDMDGRCEYSEGGIKISNNSEVFRDGSLVVIDNVSYRVHIPRNWGFSTSSEIDLLNPSVSLDIDSAKLTAIFTQGKADCCIGGEPIRLLYVYAQLKKEYPNKWFSSEDIFAHWIEAGGNPSSPLERLNWERAKIKNSLIPKSVKNIESLFARKKEKRKWLIQLSICADNISLV